MTDERIVETRETRRSSWQLPALIVLGLIAIGGLGFGWNASSKLDSTHSPLLISLRLSNRRYSRMSLPCVTGSLKMKRPTLICKAI